MVWPVLDASLSSYLHMGRHKGYTYVCTYVYSELLFRVTDKRFVGLMTARTWFDAESDENGCSWTSETIAAKVAVGLRPLVPD